MEIEAGITSICIFCKKNIEDNSNSDVIQTIGEKGAKSIHQASVERGDTICIKVGSKVHKNCRTQYVDKAKIQRSLKNGASNKLNINTRNSKYKFENDKCCLFCGKYVDKSGKYVDKSHFHCVKTDTFTTSIHMLCDERKLDEWAMTVKGRIEFLRDLHAADCIYHQDCSSHFRQSAKQMPIRNSDEPTKKPNKGGRPKDDDREQAFLKMCDFIQKSDDEQFTISELSNKMKDFLTCEYSKPYSNNWLKRKLESHFKDKICISKGEGLCDIVTFVENSTDILRSHFEMNIKNLDADSQKKAIIETAAKLIKSDIKKIKSHNNLYPDIKELSIKSALEYLPYSLYIMLMTLFVGTKIECKIASIGQAIIQAVRPRAVIAPLQLALGVQLHHLFRSKLLIDTVSALGYSVPYKEVLRFEKNAAKSVTPDILNVDNESSRSMVLYAGDNVDHNKITLDGKGTFHGMGMIAAITPGIMKKRAIQRLKTSEIDIVESSKVNIVDFKLQKNVHQDKKFQNICNPNVYDRRVDIYWQLSFNFNNSVPNWQGMMHTLHKGNQHPGQSSIIYLPMIDMYSGDKSCILSTMEYMCDLSKKSHVSPIITFDQPLYWKAAEIIHNAPDNSCLKDIVLLLGSFHTFMNFLGAIGKLMHGSGLKNILEVVYGENAVIHMLTGKSVQRSFRGHLMVDKCLNKIIVSKILETDPGFKILIDQIEQMYTSIVDGKISLESAISSDIIDKVQEKITNKIKPK